MKSSLFTLSILLWSFIGIAQQDVNNACGSTEQQQALFDQQPGLEEIYQHHQLLQNSLVTNEGKADSTHFIIPVVFHILHEYGSENIMDAQVYDALRVMNEEFGANDDDSVNIIPQFKPKNANSFIEFRLAAIDPDGNCTNGIEHIYSHESEIGDDFSKVHQWDRSHYLNVWVSGAVIPGVATFTYEPVLTNGNNFWMDGIMILHSYVGSIGTGAPFVESTITHQTGHYLGLKHPNGSVSATGTTCGDDGIADTPITKGWYICETDTNVLKDCDPNIVEDVNNYMEQSWCQFHFTAGQSDFMHNTLQSTEGERNVLSQPNTLIATGVENLTMPQLPPTVPLCPPVADFSASATRVCIGANVFFMDASWNAVIDNWEWIFEDGSPAITTANSPNVSFPSSGWKDVTLIVSNAAGADTLVMEDYIFVSPDWPNFVGPATLDMEGTQDWLFVVENPENNEPYFQAVEGVGYDNSKAFKLNNYKDVSNVVPYSDDYFYYNRLGKSRDNLMTPSFNLVNTTNITVGFWYAYASMATQQGGVDAILKVYSSRNCGESWVTRKTIQGANLVTGGLNNTSDFTPAGNNEWNYAEFTYTPNAQDTKTHFLFEFVASDSSNNLYIDQFSVNGVLATDNISLDQMNCTVYPNPNRGEQITVSLAATGEPVYFTLTDLSGKVILEDKCEQTQGDVNYQLKDSGSLPQACYLLHIRSGNYSSVHRVVRM